MFTTTAPLRMRLTYCTFKAQSFQPTCDRGPSPISVVLKQRNAHAADLILKTIAAGWQAKNLDRDEGYSGRLLDCVNSSELLALLEKFPNLAIEFLTQHVSLVDVSDPFDTTGLEPRQLHEHWVHTALHHDIDYSKVNNPWLFADTGMLDKLLSKLTTGAKDYHRSETPYKLLLLGDARKAAAIKRLNHLKRLRSWNQFWNRYGLNWILKFITRHIQRKHTPVNATPLILPLAGFHTPQVLQLCVDIATSQGSADIFKSDILHAVIDLHWGMYGNRAHISSFVVYLMLLALFVLLTAYFAEMLNSTDESTVLAAWALQYVKCAFTGYFVLQEVREAVAVTPLPWLHDFWNIMDITAYTLVVTAVIMQATAADTAAHLEQNARVDLVNSVAAVLLWFKLLYYMRPYKSTGM
jgi:Ion transport protein